VALRSALPAFSSAAVGILSWASRSACSRCRCGVWWLAIAGLIDHRVGRLGPHAKALARCCCCLGLCGGDGGLGWWLRLALVVVVVVRWHSRVPRVLL
jgi:hypothetical protein